MSGSAEVVRVEGIGRMRWFALWLCGFYTAWLAIVLLGDRLQDVVQHWPIAVAMAFGSYAAGSTPVGGGTVGFPILVLLFDQPAAMGRDFGFAIQSVGMTSATLYILCSGVPIEWRMLRWAMLGSLLATPPAVAFLAPRVDDLTVKLLFSVAWASFGLMHFVRLREICAVSGITRMPAAFDRWGGLAVGVVGGGAIASLTGVGIDLLLYVLLVLVARADLKIAIPTSVIVMAWTSLVGTATLGVLSLAGAEGTRFSEGLFGHWLAAAPVVILGAPFGAFAVERIGRRPTLVVVSVLCVGQFGWTLWHERALLDATGYAAALGCVVLFCIAYQWMYTAGRRSARTRAHDALPPG